MIVLSVPFSLLNDDRKIPDEHTLRALCPYVMLLNEKASCGKEQRVECMEEFHNLIKLFLAVASFRTNTALMLEPLAEPV